MASNNDTKKSDDFKKLSLIGTTIDSVNATMVAKTSNGAPNNQLALVVPKVEPGPSAMQPNDRIKSETLAAFKKLQSGGTEVKAVTAVKCTMCNRPITENNIPGKKYCSDQCGHDALLKERQKQQQLKEKQLQQQKALALSQTNKKRERGADSVKVYLPKIAAVEVEERETRVVEYETEGESSRSSWSDDHYAPPKKKKKPDDSFDWKQLLKTPDFEAATVSLIKHAPLSRMWENINVGMKLEVENDDITLEINEKAYWVASVIKVQGYYGLLRYEGFGNDPSSDFWIHLCSEAIHHVGWCANKGKPLIPPRSISKKFSDWRNFLVNRLTGARTLPLNFRTKITNGMKVSSFHVGTLLEVIDKTQISQLRVAKVVEIVGKRLHVEYVVGNKDGVVEDFWCHEESRLIHHTGWAKTIGHKIMTPPDYDPPMIKPTPYDPEYEAMDLRVGMKLEAIDPLNLSAICAATIKQVLRRGYVMVRIDSYEEDSTGNDWFCFHISSPSVFYCGFCMDNGIVLTPPTGYLPGTFNWLDYFEKTKTEPAPVKAKKPITHKFKEGMKVEAADLMDPRLICVATISKVVGRLLKIHFDGWEDDFDQWMDARSPDIYPIGWCELADHKLEPPRPPQPVPKPSTSKKAKKGKKKVTNGKGAKAATPKAGSKTNNGTIVAKTKNENPESRVSTTFRPSPPPPPVFSKHFTPISIFPDRRSSANQSNGEALELEWAEEVEKQKALDQSASPAPVVVPKSKKVAVLNEEPKLSIDPSTWSVEDVVTFLIKNDCGTYAEGFRQHGVNGEKMITLTKDQMIEITGMKVGPAVKIFEMISQLKKRVNCVVKNTTSFVKFELD